MEIICFHNPDEENGFLSNWYPSRFAEKGREYVSAEQYMMARKAMLFSDDEALSQIMNAEDPAVIKALGRSVRNYNGQFWDGMRQIAVYQGLLLKFSQNEDLLAKLLATDDAILAECAVRDQIWGIGLSMMDPDRLNPEKWRGRNLLGFALMAVREELRGKQKYR